MKSVVCLFAAVMMFAAVAECVPSGADTVTLRYFKDGKLAGTEEIALVKIGENIRRLQVPVEKLWFRERSKYDSVGVVYAAANAEKGTDGYWVIGDGRLGKFNKDNGALRERRNPMPIYGVKKGESAVVGVIKGLKYEFEMCVDVKDGRYSVYPCFLIKEIGTKPYEDIVVDYTFLEGARANYAGMARAYRAYQLGRGEVRPLRERVVGNSTLEYTVGAVFMKFQLASFMREEEVQMNRGWHWKAIDDPPMQTYRTFEQMKNRLRRMKVLGINEADIILTNWNLRSNGRNPMCSLAEPELGGNAGCKELIALAKELGYQISPHILHTENYTVSPWFCKDDIATDEDGTLKGYMGMGGKGFNPCFIQVYRKHILDNYDNMKALGFNGPIHIDVTTAITPYNCFNIDHFATRQTTAEYMNKVGMLSRAFFGGWTSEASCDQCANTLDYALYVSAYPAYLGAEHPLMDRCVPLWQLVYHGIILSTPFASCIDHNIPTDYANEWGPKTSFPSVALRRLKLHEFGGRLAYYWKLREDDSLEYVKSAYDEYQRLKHLQWEFMDEHNEIAAGVFESVFSNGERIVVNYNDKAVSVGGVNVPAMDFVLVKKAAK